MHERCTLYFQMHFVPSDALCTFTFESTKYIGRYITMYISIYVLRDIKKGTEYIRKYIYVLSDVS